MLAFPGNITDYRLYSPLPPGAFSLIYKQALIGQEYRVRISAVDGSGQMAGFLSKYGDYFISLGEGFYQAAPMGAVVVRALPPPPVGRPQ